MSTSEGVVVDTDPVSVDDFGVEFNKGLGEVLDGFAPTLLDEIHEIVDSSIEETEEME